MLIGISENIKNLDRACDKRNYTDEKKSDKFFIIEIEYVENKCEKNEKLCCGKLIAFFRSS